MKSPIKMKKVLKKRNVSAWFFVVGSTRHVSNRNNNEQKKKREKVYGVDGNRINLCLAFFSTF